MASIVDSQQWGMGQSPAAADELKLRQQLLLKAQTTVRAFEKSIVQYADPRGETVGLIVAAEKGTRIQ